MRLNTFEIKYLQDKILASAYAAHPERFVRGQPSAEEVPTAVWINKPKEKEVTMAG
jgi:putative transposase